MDWWIDGLMGWWVEWLFGWWIDGLMVWWVDWLMKWLINGFITWLIYFKSTAWFLMLSFKLFKLSIFIVILFWFRLDTIFGNKKRFLNLIFFTIYARHFSHFKLSMVEDIFFFFFDYFNNSSFVSSAEMRVTFVEKPQLKIINDKKKCRSNSFLIRQSF